VWLGRADGRIRALSTDTCRTYCACVAHPDDQAVRGLAPLGVCVTSISAARVRVHSKGGVLKLDRPCEKIAGKEAEFRALAALGDHVVCGGSWGSAVALDPRCGLDVVSRLETGAEAACVCADGGRALIGGRDGAVPGPRGERCLDEGLVPRREDLVRV